MVFEAVGHTCPTKGANATTSSLTGVELILYRGADYYAGNFSAGPYGQTAISYLTVWFTNTTIYCITPPNGIYPACPQNTNTETTTTASNFGYGSDLIVAYATVKYSGCWTGTYSGHVENWTGSTFVTKNIPATSWTGCGSVNSTVTIASRLHSTGGEASITASVQKTDSSDRTLTLIVGSLGGRYNFTTSKPYGNVSGEIGIIA